MSPPAVSSAKAPVAVVTSTLIPPVPAVAVNEVAGVIVVAAPKAAISTPMELIPNSSVDPEFFRNKPVVKPSSNLRVGAAAEPLSNCIEVTVTAPTSSVPVVKIALVCPVPTVISNTPSVTVPPPDKAPPRRKHTASASKPPLTSPPTTSKPTSCVAAVALSGSIFVLPSSDTENLSPLAAWKKPR